MQSTSLNLAKAIAEELDTLIATRRDLHQHPELGFQEFRTSEVVAKTLESYGLSPERGVATTGVVALLDSQLPGPTMLLRADMDALPIHEETGAEYASRHDGKMHACGHDGHTAILLTAAKLLNQQVVPWSGKIKLVFQPAEEGPGGAEPMIRAGVLQNPKVDVAFGLHLWSPMSVGQAGVFPGPMMAAADTFKVTIQGRGGHAAQPQSCVDPILVAAHMITALQAVSSRFTSPFQPVVVSVTRIQAGTADNIIPDSLELGGTVRTFDEKLRLQVREQMRTVIDGICAAFGASAEFVYREGYPPLVNDVRVAALVESLCRETLKLSSAPLPDARTMGGEDMAYFLREVPGCFFFLGSGGRPSCDYTHHHPRFDLDERALPLGVELFLRFASRYSAEFSGTPS
jgi:amidohydrolase